MTINHSAHPRAAHPTTPPEGAPPEHAAEQAAAGLTGRAAHEQAAAEQAAYQQAAADFAARYPGFDSDGAHRRLRREEYGRLDRAGQVYLDYTGGSLYAASQVDAHADLLRTAVLGNPHSDNPASLASSRLAEAAREAISEFLGAPREEYLCVLTANASAALRLVGESYPHQPGGVLALTADNHNSVNGIREFARRQGSRVCYVPVTTPELRVDRAALRRVLLSPGGAPPRTPRGDARPAGDGARRLLAFPAQSNFSGVRHDLDMVAEARAAGWDVLVDAAAYAPTNAFDAHQIAPDFAAFSFYKITGYPTGVGCLLIRRDRAALLRRPWFAGGTVTIASVGGDGHYLQPGEAAFEDGTVDYLSLPAVTAGLAHIQRVGIEAIGYRVHCLTAWLLGALGGLEHDNGRPLVQVLGPRGTDRRGGTIAFRLHGADGEPVEESLVEALAGREGISLRTGCFCNPGAGEAALGLTAGQMRPWFGRPEPVTQEEFRDGIRAQCGARPAAIRASLGVASNFADVYRFTCFLRRFLNRSAADARSLSFGPADRHVLSQPARTVA
jgi:selenocysteine lyase/cysteine desulfurase